ncbi:hypothetical protein SteCoe_29785 [Stentor coeruleus]|uniref:Uncharacterized protein n=1 Tax=Stentor coeruleus TaxID=5963 RepID=A0A1R2B560_9CILI|nr:hypothetical protein SteCoe_29785 [Stentor coeruleus]
MIENCFSFMDRFTSSFKESQLVAESFSQAFDELRNKNIKDFSQLSVEAIAFLIERIKLINNKCQKQKESKALLALCYICHNFKLKNSLYFMRKEADFIFQVIGENQMNRGWLAYFIDKFDLECLIDCSETYAKVYRNDFKVDNELGKKIRQTSVKILQAMKEPNCAIEKNLNNFPCSQLKTKRKRRKAYELDLSDLQIPFNQSDNQLNEDSILTPQNISKDICIMLQNNNLCSDKVQYFQVDRASHALCLLCDKFKISISNTTLLSESRFIANALGIKFFGSQGWVHSFKNRYKIIFNKDYSYPPTQKVPKKRKTDKMNLSKIREFSIKILQFFDTPCERILSTIENSNNSQTPLKRRKISGKKSISEEKKCLSSKEESFTKGMTNQEKIREKKENIEAKNEKRRKIKEKYEEKKVMMIAKKESLGEKKEDATIKKDFIEKKEDKIKIKEYFHTKKESLGEKKEITKDKKEDIKLKNENFATKKEESDKIKKENLNAKITDSMTKREENTLKNKTIIDLI